jgi:HD-GYP domain-containing protein (c-di-GMP phosphodiesterase class II)
MPMAWVPIAVVGVLATRVVPDVIVGRAPAVRLVRCVANSWFAIGPPLVFAVANIRPDQAGALLLIAALLAQFAVDVVASSAYLSITRGVSLLSQMHGSLWVYAIDAALSAVGLVIAEQQSVTPYAVLAVLPLLGLLRMFADERRERLGKLLELNETYRGTALLLGDVISADDNYTGEHSEGVVDLALAVGDALGLDPERRRDLEFGAMLHDVGKITIPKEIINKPGKLDPHEWEIIKTHPAAGQRMLERIGGFMLEVGDIVRAHHERWDGRGYPDGLAGEAIPLEARIITCCDSWSAMRTDRPYRAAMSVAAATAEMIANSGAQFDPEVVKAMLPVVAATEASGVSPEASAEPVAPAEPVSAPTAVGTPVAV